MACIRRTLGLALLWPVLVFALPGCAGPSTAVLPREELRPAREAAAALPDASADRIRETLAQTCGQPRPAESESLAAAGQYLAQELSSCGYEVSEEEGTVMAVRRADAPDCDIVLAEAEYGSKEHCPGAFTNGSGTAVLLETARLLSAVPTDTELRFYFFPISGKEPGAARRIASRLSNEEAARCLGFVRAGKLGAPEGPPPSLVTSDGEDTYLSSCIRDSVMERTGWKAQSAAGDRPVCSVFERRQIPAVSFEEEAGLYEEGTAFEKAELLDAGRLAQSADALALAFAQLMDKKSLSMQAKSHYYNDIRDSAYVQRKEPTLPFGEGREQLEALTGQNGALYSENQDAEGRTIEAWQYPMKWFGVDQIIPTNFYYYDGCLQEVVLDADSVGVDWEDIQERVTACYGGYTGFTHTPNGTEYEWALSGLRLRIGLVPANEGYVLSMTEFDTPKTSLAQDSLGTDILRGQVERVFPAEALEKLDLVFYTDGKGGTAGYLKALAPSEDGAGTAIAELGLDEADAVDENGVLKDEAGTVRFLAGLYADYLLVLEPERYAGADLRGQLLNYLLADEPEQDGAGEGAGLGRYEELSSYREWVRKNLNRG